MEHTRRILRRLLVLALVLAALTVCALAADTTAADADGFFAALEENLKAQNEKFTITYTGDRGELNIPRLQPLGSTLREMSARSADGPDNADYPALNVNEGAMRWDGDDCIFTIEYLATLDELEEVDRRAGEIVGSFSLDGESDLTKIKLLYEYICTHYTYDDTLTKFSAYDGLTTGSMVCQGYALLTYRVMWDAGIPCRIVTGTSAGENHAWNIVELDGAWYNLDTTWDAVDEIGGIMNWTYFLKSTRDFTGHKRFEPYTTEAYEKAHPMAEESVVLSQIKLRVGGDDLSHLIIRVGIEAQLEAVLPEGVTASEVQWASSSPDVIAITADGRLTATGLGEAVITAGIGADRGIISAQLAVESVDLRTASDWAEQSVTDYYLAQLLPSTLCSDFQDGVTRAELARLCYQNVLRQRGWGTMLLQNPFDDIGDCPDALAILRCEAVGLMRGTSGSTFSPDALVTREQAAVVLSRLMVYLGCEAPDLSRTRAFTDEAEISGWAADSVDTASAAGLLRGSGGAYHPKEAMTLEQMIVALERLRQITPVLEEKAAA